jgi:hypothetical protein
MQFLKKRFFLPKEAIATKAALETWPRKPDRDRKAQFAEIAEKVPFDWMNICSKEEHNAVCFVDDDKSKDHDEPSDLKESQEKVKVRQIVELVHANIPTKEIVATTESTNIFTKEMCETTVASFSESLAHLSISDNDELTPHFAIRMESDDFTDPIATNFAHETCSALKFAPQANAGNVLTLANNDGRVALQVLSRNVNCHFKTPKTKANFSGMSSSMESDEKFDLKKSNYLMLNKLSVRNRKSWLRLTTLVNFRRLRDEKKISVATGSSQTDADRNFFGTATRKPPELHRLQLATAIEHSNRHLGTLVRTWNLISENQSFVYGGNLKIGGNSPMSNKLAPDKPRFAIADVGTRLATTQHLKKDVASSRGRQSPINFSNFALKVKLENQIVESALQVAKNCKATKSKQTTKRKIKINFLIRKHKKANTESSKKLYREDKVNKRTDWNHIKPEAIDVRTQNKIDLERAAKLYHVDKVEICLNRPTMSCH